MPDQNQPEPWLRGTHTDVPAVARGAIHALELAREDIEKWCTHLNDDEWNSTPAGLTTLGYHVMHIARSLDRLLTYAEGSQLTRVQLDQLAGERTPISSGQGALQELYAAIEHSSQRILKLAKQDLEQPRWVGRQKLPTTLGVLLVHIADHTQRHVGQAIITAKVVLVERGVF